MTSTLLQTLPIGISSIPRPGFGLCLLWLAVWIGAPAAIGFLIGLIIAPVVRLLHRLVAATAILTLFLSLAGVLQIESVGSVLGRWGSWFGASALPSTAPQSPETLGAIAAFLVGKCIGLATFRVTRASEKH
jgi:hypothetical protein